MPTRSYGPGGVHRRIGVGTVWEFKPAVAGIDCRLLQRRRAAAKPGLAGRSVDSGDPGQAQDLSRGGSDGTGGTWSGRAFSIRHLSPMSTPGRVGSRGGVAGAEPPHKGGPNRPDRPKLQWLVVSGQWSERAHILAATGMGTDRGLIASRGMRLITPILGGTPPVRKTVPGRTIVLY